MTSDDPLKSRIKFRKNDIRFFQLLAVAALLGIVLAVAWTTLMNNRLLRDAARSSAVHWAERVKSDMNLEQLVKTGILSTDARNSLRMAATFGDVFRYRIYTADGTVIAASRFDDIGIRQGEGYFTTQVTRGQTFVKIEAGRTDRPVRNFAQALMPIMEGAEFVGAVEVFVNLERHVGIYSAGFALAAVGLAGLLLLSAAVSGAIVYRNIAVRHLAEVRLRLARDDAEIANRAKTRFLANMSHELRTPLNAIIGFSEILKSEINGPLGDPSYHEYVDDIYMSGTHLYSIINDILDISRIEAGDHKLREEVMSIAETIEGCGRLIHQRAGEMGVAVTGEIAPELPHLLGDERLIKQMLINLVANAIKFTPEGGTVSICATITDDGWLEISVADTGIGIAEQDLERVMRPFQQVDGDLNRQYDGIGLGLALVKSFVELHDGRIELASTLGQGTTVTAFFPPERVVPVEGVQTRPAA